MDATQRRQTLEQQHEADMIRLDRHLEELEQFGAQRVLGPIEHIAADLDLDRLKSLIFDIDAALTRDEQTRKELKRLA